MSTAAAPFHNTAYTILYRGNSVNGWLSAFLSYVALHQQGKKVIRMVPQCGHRQMTLKDVMNWANTHVLMLDMDDQDPAVFIKGGALSFESISSLSWDAEEKETSTIVNVWRRWYREAPGPMPFWLSSVDRITRWAAPLWEDRCLRHVFLPVAHMPPADALVATDALMTWMMNPTGVEFQNLMAQAQTHLMEKDQALCVFLKEKGVVHDITDVDVEAWGLTAEWVGLKAFLVENHDTVLDTNEAAHLVFTNYPDVGIFVNYRKKMRTGQGLRMVYVYSARSKVFDLTTGGFFEGRPGSAGAQVAMDRVVMPFVVPVAAPVSASVAAPVAEDTMA